MAVLYWSHYVLRKATTSPGAPVFVLFISLTTSARLGSPRFGVGPPPLRPPTSLPTSHSRDEKPQSLLC
eukprot:1428957-Heterocapsa_arctica.AAC.1